MDKNTIQQDLNNIVKEEILDDMNILPEIHKQLKKQPSSTLRPMITLSRVAAVIAIFVLVSAAGYALIQRNIVSNSIPQQIITDINETQTLDDVDLTLNWAYADAHRITIAYSMEYLPTDTFINIPTVTLKTADGTYIPPAFGGGGGGGGAPNQPTISESLINFDASVINTEADSVDLVLTIDFSAETVLSNPMQTYMGNNGEIVTSGGGGGGSSSGGGGGGGGDAPVPTLDASKLIDRIYTFNITLPFYKALEVEPIEDTIESNGITMTVNNIRYTPSLTKFDICYNVPDDDTWFAQVQVITDSPNSPFYTSSVEPMEVDTDDSRQCFQMSVAAAIEGEENALTMNVLFLSQPIGAPLTYEDARAEEAYFAEQGYIIEIDEDPYGYSFDLLEFPADTTAIEAQGYLMANLFYKRYEGDWAFEVPLR